MRGAGRGELEKVGWMREHLLKSKGEGRWGEKLLEREPGRGGNDWTVTNKSKLKRKDR